VKRTIRSLYWASQHFRSAVLEETLSNCSNSTAESTLYAGWNLWSTATPFRKQDQLMVLGDTGEDFLAKPRPNVINLFNLSYSSRTSCFRLCNFHCSSINYFSIVAQIATIDGFRVSHLRKLACCRLLLLLLVNSKWKEQSDKRTVN